ncbi:hypothetical protein [Clostridioides difficile]|nr:hypothetical protein [Clostridioides difficile]EQI44558.1 hypothetical protein QQ1_3574 [Clostridioides difficile Y247]EQJ32648.1 hypothetical protein QSA_3540 [Clostridioides difficile P21]
MGEEKAWQYMDKLHKYWCIHSSGSAQLIAASGEYPLVYLLE